MVHIFNTDTTVLTMLRISISLQLAFMTPNISTFYGSRWAFAGASQCGCCLRSLCNSFSASRFQILHFDLAFFSLAFFLFQNPINICLRDAWILQYSTEERKKVGCDAELAPELVNEIGFGRHRHHNVEVEEDQDAKNYEHRGERP